jgi:hypothetical protein
VAKQRRKAGSAGGRGAATARGVAAQARETAISDDALPGGAASTLTQRQQERIASRRAFADARRRQKRIRLAIVVAIAVIALVAGGFVAFSRGGSGGDNLGTTDEIAQANGTPVVNGEAGVAFPDLGGGHVAQGQTVTTYNSDPPTSGQHWPVTASWGIHTEAVPNEFQVHNLEHGGIVIQYDCPDGCADVIAQLSAIVNRYPVKLLLAPRDGMSHQIVLTAWGRMLTLDHFNNVLIQRFINAYIDKGPENIPSETQQLKDSQN